MGRIVEQVESVLDQSSALVELGASASEGILESESLQFEFLQSSADLVARQFPVCGKVEQSFFSGVDLLQLNGGLSVKITQALLLVRECGVDADADLVGDFSLSQEKLGQVIGLHWTFVGQVERGQRNLSLHNILKMAAGLEMDAGDLLIGLRAP